MELTDNLNIKQFKPLTAPEKLKADLPETEAAAHLVAESRRWSSGSFAGTISSG